MSQAAGSADAAASLLAALQMAPAPSSSPPPPELGAAAASSAAPSASALLRASTPAHQAVTLMLQNQFAACRAHCAQHSASAPCALIASMLLFIEAASSYAESELTATLSHVWSLEKRASTVKTTENRLVRADCYFLGSLVQLINQSYVKCAWNMRKSWNHYVAAQKELQTYRGRDAAELLGWCQYGSFRRMPALHDWTLSEARRSHWAAVGRLLRSLFY